MTQLWHANMEAGHSTVCVFLDLAKAFDSVSHLGGITDALISARIKERWVYSSQLGWGLPS